VRACAVGYLKALHSEWRSGDDLKQELRDGSPRVLREVSHQVEVGCLASPEELTRQSRGARDAAGVL